MAQMPSPLEQDHIAHERMLAEGGGADHWTGHPRVQRQVGPAPAPQ